MAKSTDVVFENFQNAIADSPHMGFADIRNLDVTSKPGVALLNFVPQMITPAPVSVTFTADSTTDILTLTSSTLRWNGHGATKRAVTVSSSGSLPTGLSAATTYWAIDVTSSTLKLATTRLNAEAATAIDLTSNGTGTLTITTIDIGLVKFFASDATHIFGQDTNGRVWEFSASDWYLLSGNTLTNSNAQGLAIFQNYLFAFRSRLVDVYGPFSSAEGSRAWQNDWQILTASTGDSNPHVALTGKDDILYFADRNTTSGVPYIGSIQHIGTFDPTNAATFTFTPIALTLPAYKTITCLDELGVNLMIGTSGREIYPWDRTSTSFLVNQTIVAGETNIQAMRTLNNVLYFAAGTRGSIYFTVGSITRLLRRLPTSITGIPFNTVTISSMIAHKGKIFFTVGVKGASGVYSLDISTGQLIFEHRITTSPIDASAYTGTYGTIAVTFGSLYSNGAESLIIPWKDVDNTLYGIDNTLYINYYYYPTYAGYFDSDLREVGSNSSPRTFSNVIMELDKPLASGEGIKLSYRKNLSDAFTLMATFDYATYAAEQSFIAAAPITDASFVQIRMEMTVAVTTSSSPELRTIILQ